MKHIMITIIFLVIALGQLPGMINKKHWKELVVVSIIYSISFTLSMLLSFGVKIPNPHEGINFLIESLVY